MSEEILPPYQGRVIEQAKLIFSPLGKALEKEKKRLVDTLNSLSLCNQIDELKQIESIIPKNQWNNLIIDKLEKLMQLKINIK